jgi:hypothetical protein
MTVFVGRAKLLERIRELHRSGQHISIVGARAIGKTAVLQAVVAQHETGSEVFAGAGIVDFRHDPPTSTEAALKRVGGALQRIFETAAKGELKYLASEVSLDATPEELYDQLKIALDMVAESKRSVLLVLDGCDPVLQNSAIPRNLWDNLRALAQSKALRLMTGSRDHLHRLCYNPDARTSDFFRIFYDEPLVVGPYGDADWKGLYATSEVRLDGSAEKEMVNWTGGHPDLVNLLLGRLREVVGDKSATKLQVDEAAESLLSRASGRLDSLWIDCPEESRADVIQLLRGEVPAGDLPNERINCLVDRGIAVEVGKKLRLVNRFIERLASARKSDVGGAKKLFERPEDFATNIRTVLELRLAHVQGGDAELRKLVRRCLGHLPSEPDGAVGGARDILDRALEIIWAVEAPDGAVPKKWLDHWKDTEVRTGKRINEAADYSRTPGIPEERGRQCGLLRLATGKQGVRPIASKVTKTAYVLLEHMSQVGDWKNHSKGTPTVSMASAFCATAIELLDTLASDLRA